MNQFTKSTRRLTLACQHRISGQTCRRWMDIFSAMIVDAEQHLTDLDCAIGDGDHGVNMRRGMAAVLAKLDQMSIESLSGQLRVVSTTLMTSVGGASGPLYGAFFLQSSHSTLNRADWGLPELTAAVEAGYRGVVQLGKASVGDKTMVDSLAAAVRSLRHSCGRHEALPQALDACRIAVSKAAEGTTPMIARKGRASYLGHRSAGVQDPGATSASLLIDALAEAVESISPHPQL